jgi:Tfp pilus assembly protein PilP
MAFPLPLALLLPIILVISPQVNYANGAPPDRRAPSRDPFKPIPAVRRDPQRDSRDLKDYPLEELRLTALFVTINGERRASLENRDGIGFPVRIGTEIGPDNAKVVEITHNSIVVELAGDGALGRREIPLKP